MGTIRNKITSRPPTKHIYDTPKPISIDCVKNWLMALGMAFDWLDRTPTILQGYLIHPATLGPSPFALNAMYGSP